MTGAAARRAPGRLFAWLPACACVVAACGGGGDGTDTTRVGIAPPPVCPGVDASQLDALYVSPQGTDDLCGLGGTKPCKTIGYALGLANLLRAKALVMQHGLYQTTETIDLKDGVSLYGSCLFGGEPDRRYRTVIQAAPAPGTPAIRASGVTVTVSGVVVVANDQTAGNANVAMTAAGANVTLRSTVLVAGNGGAAPARQDQPGPSAASRPTRLGGDQCSKPGGAASDSPWGQIDLGSFAWAAGVGGAGAADSSGDAGGVGGQQGGASIGLLLVNGAVVNTVPNEFNRFVAGAGGAGGTGQAGPSFGNGGGALSGGAGGNGGPSIGVASANAAGVPSGDSYLYAGAPGGPGAPGAAGVDPNMCQGDPGAPGTPGGSAAAYAFPTPTTLTAGESLALGQSVYSPSLQYKLSLGGDGNLCLYNASGTPTWCSQTSGAGVYQAIMQSDGNFCIYETGGRFLTVCSGTAERPGARLTVVDSGHAQVIDAGGTVRWSVP